MANKPIQSTTSHARVIYWHYKRQNFGAASNLRSLASDGVIGDTVAGVIETEIEQIEVEKSITSPSGTFSITLLPSKNWKALVSPGDWLVIQLFNQNDSPKVENKNIVMIGNVDRVARSKQKDEQTDKTIVRYTIQGRDFGKVFEDTAIFFNPYIGETSHADLIKTMLHTQGLPLTGNPSKMVTDIVNIFLAGQKIAVETTNKSLGKAIIDALQQWRIPTALVQFFSGGSLPQPALAFGGSSYFHSILKKNIEPDLPGNGQNMTLTPGANSNLWSYIYRCSNYIVNDVFLDLDRDDDGAVLPAVYLRPRPNSPFFAPAGIPSRPVEMFPLKGKFIDLIRLSNNVDELAEVTSEDVKFDNLGRDDHARFNVVWLHPKMADLETSVNQFNNVQSSGGIGLPMQLTESIFRYGLKITEEQIEFVYPTITGGDLNAQAPLFKGFIYQRYDQIAYHHLYETGTIETVGNIKARLGKVLRILNSEAKSVASGIAQVPGGLLGPPAKLYYVEGYKHTWKFPSHWSTEWTVTCGHFEDYLKPFIDMSAEDKGQPDTAFNATSLTQTNVNRDAKGGGSGAESLLEAGINAVTDFIS